MAEKITCKKHCWKIKLCEVGQKKNEPCRYFEPDKRDLLGETGGDPGQKHGRNNNNY